MVPYKRVFFPTFLPNRTGIKQSFDRSDNNDSNNTSMANTIPVLSVTSKTVNTINMKHATFAPNPKSFGRSEQRTSFFSGKRKLATPSMDRFKRKLITEGILKEYASPLSDGQRSITVSHHELA